MKSRIKGCILRVVFDVCVYGLLCRRMCIYGCLRMYMFVSVRVFVCVWVCGNECMSGLCKKKVRM